MATFSSGPNGIDMSTLALPNAVVSEMITPTVVQTTLQNGANETYAGSFFSPSGMLSGGTATSYERDFTNSGGGFGGDPYGYGGYTVGTTTKVFSITNANVPASEVAQSVAAPDSTRLLHFFLTGGDTYVGSSASDVLIGQGGNDTFVGGSGTETFKPAGGNNTINGGSGVDTVVFKGPSTDYTITDNGDGSITVSDSVAGRNGTDHITSVIQLQFTDKAIFPSTADDASIARLYSAALNRVPDAPGLHGWEVIYQTGVSAGTKSQGPFVALAETVPTGISTSIAGGFTNSTEFQQKYGPLDDTGFVTQLYQNVLNRLPDAAGLNGWLNLIHNGDASGMHFTREMVLVGFAESPENIAKTSHDWLFPV